MIQFLDGPARGITLSLRRAPILLRVVRSSRQWDALDLLADQPEADEDIFVYRLVGEVTHIHLHCGTGKHRHAGGWYAMGQYIFHPDQPGDQQMRDSQAWSEWCHSVQGAVIALRKQEAIDRPLPSGEAVSPAARGSTPRHRAGSVVRSTSPEPGLNDRACQGERAGANPDPALAPASSAMPSDGEVLGATSPGDGGRPDDDVQMQFDWGSHG